MKRRPHEVMLDAFEACGPDNRWAAAAASMIRDSPTPEVVAVLLEVELERAAEHTCGAHAAWLRALGYRGDG